MVFRHLCVLRRPLLILLLTFFALKGSAQFSDSIYYHFNYTSSGNYNKTNTNRSFLLNNTVNLNYRRKPLVVNFTNKWLYGQQQATIVNNDFSSLLDLNLYKTFRHFYY